MFASLPYWLQVAACAAVIVAIVPLCGAAVLGSWRAGWRFALAWGRSVGIMIVAAALLTLAF